LELINGSSALNWEDAVRTLLDDPSQQELVRQCYFDLPLLRAAKRYYKSEEWASVRRKSPLSGHARALDVGAGNGVVSYSLARDGWAVTSVEPDPSGLVGCGAIRQLAKTAGLSLRIVEGVAEDLDVPSGWFDAIFVRQVFHHAPDIYPFAARLAELLAPGGLLLTFFDRHPLHNLYEGENAFREGEYASALTSAGLNILTTWRHFDDPMNYGPLSPAGVFAQAAGRVLPPAASQIVGKVLGNRIVFGAIAPLLSTIDRRPGRLVAFLARKKR
jgi:SAM-dependent methyltransferase